MADARAPSFPPACEALVPCPLLPCGRVLVRYRRCPVSRRYHFDGAYDPRTLCPVGADADWRRWFARVLAWRGRDSYLEVRPPVPLATDPVA